MSAANITAMAWGSLKGEWKSWVISHLCTSVTTNQHSAMRTVLDPGMRGRARNKGRSGLLVAVWQPLSPAALLEPEPGRISNKTCQDLQFPSSLPPLLGSEQPSQLLAWSSSTAACHFTVWHKVKDNTVYKKLCCFLFKDKMSTNKANEN